VQGVRGVAGGAEGEDEWAADEPVFEAVPAE